MTGIITKKEKWTQEPIERTPGVRTEHIDTRETAKHVTVRVQIGLMHLQAKECQDLLIITRG